MQYLSQRLASKSRGSRGRHPPRSVVMARQRDRILSAAERLIAERGFAGTTIERIVKAARVSTISFYEHFSDKEECFAAAFDRAVEETRARLAETVSAELPWPEQIREGLRALLAMIAENPARARMCLVEAQMGGPLLLERYEAALDSAVPKLREGRDLDPAAHTLSETLEEATIGGLAWLLHQRLEAEGVKGIEEMLPKTIDIALSPYLGPREALSLAMAAKGG